MIVRCQSVKDRFAAFSLLPTTLTMFAPNLENGVCVHGVMFGTLR